MRVSSFTNTYSTPDRS